MRKLKKEIVKIKKADKEDLPEILELQKLCYNENAERYNDYNIAPLTQTIEELEKEAEDSIILKATLSKTIAGSIRAFEKKGTCFIGRVIVHPDYQNKGIGARLMNEIEGVFKKVNRYELFTGFRDEKNLYFYDKLGYKPFKQVKYSDVFTMIFLEKVIMK